MDRIRIGIVGLGRNCRERHVPGLLACDGVEIVAVCNRTRASTERAAAEYGIPRRYERWQDVVADPDVDAVVIGTWPYLHAPVTIGALEEGKHVLCEARMARSLAEAQAMVEAARRHPELVLQIVPSPFGLEIHDAVLRYLESGRLGTLREVIVVAANDQWADEQVPLSWRQVRELSGINMVMLGILHETLIRWLPDPIEVFAQAEVFIPRRMDPTTGALVPVELPDAVHVLARFPGGAMGIYHMSNVARGGPGMSITLYGSDATVRCTFGEVERVEVAEGGGPFRELPVSAAERRGWRVEADFIDSIRSRTPVRFTDPITGLRYMSFTDAVARSLQQRAPTQPMPVSELLGNLTR